MKFDLKTKNLVEKGLKTDVSPAVPGSEAMSAPLLQHQSQTQNTVQLAEYRPTSE